jgi:peptidoglycan/LPS O-acetylase OafA/YrhL
MVTTVATASFGLALIGLRAWDAPLMRLRLVAPLRAVGQRSYSLYLIHLPVCLVVGAAFRQLGVGTFWQMAAVGVPAVLVGSLASSWLFYEWIERRFVERAAETSRETVTAAVRPTPALVSA